MTRYDDVVEVEPFTRHVVKNPGADLAQALQLFGHDSLAVTPHSKIPDRLLQPPNSWGDVSKSDRSQSCERPRMTAGIGQIPKPFVDGEQQGAAPNKQVIHQRIFAQIDYLLV